MSRRPLGPFEDYVSPEPNSGCWLWTGSFFRKGYGLYKGQRAHRFSWGMHRGPIPAGLWVLHRCDTPACVNPDHLFLGTHNDNVQDCVRKRRHRFGERQARAKLKEREVVEIIELLRRGHSQSKIARCYGVDHTIINGIANGWLWKHVPREAA